jgi:hypothetical protein
MCPAETSLQAPGKSRRVRLMEAKMGESEKRGLAFVLQTDSQINLPVVVLMNANLQTFPNHQL